MSRGKGNVPRLAADVLQVKGAHFAFVADRPSSCQPLDFRYLWTFAAGKDCQQVFVPNQDFHNVSLLRESSIMQVQLFAMLNTLTVGM